MSSEGYVHLKVLLDQAKILPLFLMAFFLTQWMTTSTLSAWKHFYQFIFRGVEYLKHLHCLKTKPRLKNGQAASLDDGLEIHLKTIVAEKSLEISGWALNCFKAYVLACNLANCSFYVRVWSGCAFKLYVPLIDCSWRFFVQHV